MTLKIFIPGLALHSQQYRAHKWYSMNNIKVLLGTKIFLFRKIIISFFSFFFFGQCLCKHPFGYSIFLKCKYVLCVKIKYLLNTFTLCLLSYEWILKCFFVAPVEAILHPLLAGDNENLKPHSSAKRNRWREFELKSDTNIHCCWHSRNKHRTT